MYLLKLGTYFSQALFVARTEQKALGDVSRELQCLQTILLSCWPFSCQRFSKLIFFHSLSLSKKLVNSLGLPICLCMVFICWIICCITRSFLQPLLRVRRYWQKALGLEESTLSRLRRILSLLVRWLSY